MIPQGPLEGDRIANGRALMAVREVKRQCLDFSSQIMNKMRSGKDGKNERIEKNWTKMEKANGAICRESLVQ